MLERDFNLPAQARIEIELDWSQKPDFDLALGVDLKDQSPARTYRFEVWKNQLVAVCEAKQEADLAAVAEIKAGAGSVHLQIFLDQARGHLLVYTAGGEQLADLSLDGAAEKGDETRADGAKPEGAQAFGGAVAVDQSRWRSATDAAAHRRLEWRNLHAARARPGPPGAGMDGSMVHGAVQNYDAGKRQFTVRTAEGPQTVDQQQARDILLSSDALDRQSQLRLVLLAGSQISGELEKVAEQKIYVRVPGIRKALGAAHRIAARAGRAATCGSAGAPAEPSPRSAGTGRRSIDRLAGGRGRIVGLGTRLAPWRSDTAAGLRKMFCRGSFTATPSRRRPSQKSWPRIHGGLLGPRACWGPCRSRAYGRTKGQNPSLGLDTPVLHLQSGDMIPCQVVRIDEEGVAFESEQADAKFVRHNQLKALELLPGAGPVAIAKAKRERLLTLPRMQRDSPPTQLIRSTEGDYVRGRLLEMDDKQLKVEVRLEPRNLPRPGRPDHLAARRRIRKKSAGPSRRRAGRHPRPGAQGRRQPVNVLCPAAGRLDSLRAERPVGHLPG